MAKKIISFGQLNLKLLLPFGLACLQIISKVINESFPKEDTNLILDIYSIGFGQISIRLMPLILKIGHSERKDENTPQKRKCLYYSILVIIFLLTFIMKFVVKGVKGEINQDSRSYNPLSDNEFIKLGLEMICIMFISRILL